MPCYECHLKPRPSSSTRSTNLLKSITARRMRQASPPPQQTLLAHVTVPTAYKSPTSFFFLYNSSTPPSLLQNQHYNLPKYKHRIRINISNSHPHQLRHVYPRSLALLPLLAAKPRSRQPRACDLRRCEAWLLSCAYRLVRIGLTCAVRICKLTSGVWMWCQHCEYMLYTS